MQELEKILEELGAYICDDLCYYRETSVDKKDDEMEEICAGCKVGEYLESIRKHMNDGWIPVEERLPEEDGFYVATMSGMLVNQEEPFVGLAEFEDGEWVDGDDVIAWRHLPEPYKPKQPETCKYTGGSCCWPIDQCSDCPNNPERSENDQ